MVKMTIAVSFTLLLIACAPERERNPKACIEMAAVIENFNLRHRNAFEEGRITQEEYSSRINENDNLKISFCLLSLVPVERNTNF
ncbi:hypothetical protein [Leptospira jelokensis]|uniref:hypothetical protein n=1 Tax=Leptospira jelokensis TaxID=2484931 RepID=UPI001090DB33|nr:hypothetical protein [Leptospira jelokensis]TGM02417.1 hypothetical protein EHQ79_13690 [Leptospira jelokensis]